MYYHLIIEKKPQFKGEKVFDIYVYDLGKEDLVSNYVIPYKRSQNFIANGYTLDQSCISRFKIVSSNETIEAIASKLTDSLRRSGVIGFYRNEDVINSEKYVKDETISVLNSVNNIQNSNITSDGVKSCKKYVFIVHGHDHGKVVEVENFIRSIGLEPIVLFKETDQGNTIIEKIERFSSESLYGIVIYTKCDIGYLAGHEDEKKYRARQNVIFEHGYLMAKLGRAKVCAVLEDNTIECPGDISGIVYKNFDNEGNWKYSIAKEMNACGIKIDFNRIR